MAFSYLTFIFLLSISFLSNVNCEKSFEENFYDFYRPQLWIISHYLNSNPDRIYNYNQATLTNAHIVGNNADLTLDIDVNCHKLSNDCVTNLMECTATVVYRTYLGNYGNILNVYCNPKTRIDAPRNEETTTEILLNAGINLESSMYNEPVSEQPITKTRGPCTGCPFDLNPNNEALNNLKEIALSHIESERSNKHVVVRIVRAQRQIVAGVKYILLLEVAPTNCQKTIEQSNLQSCQVFTENSQICEVIYYNRPWINQNKDIISNNCTLSQEFNVETTTEQQDNDQDNEIDRNIYPGSPIGQPEMRETGELPNFDSIAENGNADEFFEMTGGIMDSDRMRDLESQIIFRQPTINEETSPTEEQENINNDERLREKRHTKNDDDSSSSSSSSSSEDNNDDDDNNDDKHYEKTKKKHKKYSKHDDDNNDDDDNNNDNDTSSSSSSSSSEEDNNDKKQKSKKIKRAASSSSEEDKNKPDTSNSSSDEEINETQRPKRETNPQAPDSSEENKSSEEHRGGVRRKRSLSSDELVKITPEEKNFVENLADFSVYTLDDIDADHHKRIVLQILGAKKNLAGNLYHLTLRVGISHCPEEDIPVIDFQKPNKKDKECRNKLIESLTNICRVQIRVDNEKTVPKLEKSQCQNIKKQHDNSNINRTNRSKRGGERLVGGINTVDANDPKILEYSQNIIKSWDETEGGESKRELVKVVSASKQVVSGILYRLKLEFKENGNNLICDFEVWDQAWKNPSKKLDIQCEDQPKKSLRLKRSYATKSLGGDDHDIHIGLFKSFIAKYDKKYTNKSEFKIRFQIFRSNMKTIKNLNDNEQGTAKYGPTFFADLTSSEYKAYLGLKPSLHQTNNIPFPPAVIPNINLPSEFDWRTKGVISEVKDQGQCGSCWAFSVTGNIEGLNAIQNGKLVELSEQELVDCDTLDEGCNGGLPDNAYRAIEKLGGLESETDYPYDAEDEKCHFNKSLTKVQISGAVNISSNETDMAKWLVKNGPISIGINANAMQFYMGGISHPFKILCDPQNLDHGVLIVGYGVHKYTLFNKVLPYWIVKNSWGPRWGEQGYYRVYRGDGTCGLNLMASSAVL